MAKRGHPPDDGLEAWIVELRARFERGDLAMLARIDIGHGMHELPAELVVQIMLADLESFDDMTPEEASDPVNVAHRSSLLSDFRLLRILIG